MGRRGRTTGWQSVRLAALGTILYLTGLFSGRYGFGQVLLATAGRGLLRGEWLGSSVLPEKCVHGLSIMNCSFNSPQATISSTRRRRTSTTSEHAHSRSQTTRTVLSSACSPPTRPSWQSCAPRALTPPPLTASTSPRAPHSPSSRVWRSRTSP